MTEREALLALAVPEPEPFKQVIPSEADRARWQEWHTRRVEALRLVGQLPKEETT